jgi:SH3-like domain-containing protein
MFLLVALLVSFQLSWADTTSVYQIVDQVAAEIKQEYCPDRRTSIWEISRHLDNQDIYIIEGETDRIEARQQFVQRLNSKLDQVQYTIDILLLPNDTMDNQCYALPMNSIAILRRAPSVTAEMVTQTLRGIPMEILKAKRGFYLARTDDGYLGWVSDDRVVLGGDSLRAQWENVAKVVFIDVEGVIFSKPDVKSQPVSDVVMGNRFLLIERKKKWTKVGYADGRTGFTRTTQLMDYNKYLAKPLTANAVLTTAKKMVGRPYMWGAASPKAFDCSGFTQSVFRHNGFILERDASMQANQGVEIDTSGNFKQLKPGDLLFFSPFPERITHVGIYMGDNQFIHCSGLVTIDSFNPADSNYNDYRRQSLRRVKRIIDSN